MFQLLKPFDEMSEIDYQELGLKVGLEIHQQVLTEKKLFCRCPAGLYNEEYDAEILRHMRPTLSELGEYDGTALMEFKTKKEIIYQVNHQTVCTYEMDDTPPFEINRQALDIALEIAMLLNYKLVSEIHIARKQYLDGSIPTGFQRTTIVGIDGWIPYNDRKIGLIQLGLEEDACREVSDVGHLRVYRTDRLGMPLIEMVTQADMHTPQQAAEVANRLRWLVRSTGSVRTGIGAARQDVNVSINGGTRIEIKGVSRIPLLPHLIYNEAMRQHALLQICQELQRRGIDEKNFKYTSTNVTHLLSKTSWDPIQRALHRGEEIHCVNLKGFARILSHPTQTGKVFSKEISDRVRVIACLTRLPNILTSESTEETIDSFIWQKIRKAVGANSRDALILVWGNQNDVQTAVQEIAIRAKEAIEGVPSETRQALADGTNGFERILPGPDRMYPDTDLPPLEITPQHIDQLGKQVPEQLWSREKKYRAMGIPEHLIIPIASSPKADIFEKLIEKYDIPAVRIANFMFEQFKNWERKGFAVQKLESQQWNTFFRYASKQPAILENGATIIKSYLNNEYDSLEDILEKLRDTKIEQKKVSHKINEIITQNSLTFANQNQKHRYFMGKIMQEVRGYYPAKQVSKLLTQALKEHGGSNE